MTSKRKAEVNRLLAEFEFPNRLGGHLDPEFEVCQMRYCEDLNALARLEAKLPAHSWRIAWFAKVYAAQLLLHDHKVTDPLFESESRNQPTEAEARADAIAQYLTQRSRT